MWSALPGRIGKCVTPLSKARTSLIRFQALKAGLHQPSAEVFLLTLKSGHELLCPKLAQRDANRGERFDHATASTGSVGSHWRTYRVLGFAAIANFS